MAMHAQPALLGLAALGLAFGISANAAGAVVVDPSKTLTRESIDVPPGGRAHYAYSLAAGTELVFRLRSARWRGEPLRVWLVDELNFENLEADRPFSYIDAGTGLARRVARFVFAVPEEGVYHVVIDNPDERLQRELAVYAYANTPEPSAEDVLALRIYEDFYAELETLFELDEIDITVTRCGRVNAFSTPREIVICKELDEILAQYPTPGLRLFVLMHETAHMLQYAWGYRSTYANQYRTDRLAATLTEIMDQEALALDAARWFASTETFSEASFENAQFTMRKTRALRLAEWLSSDFELDLAWTRRIVFPRMRTEALESLLSRPGLDARVHERIEAELSERRDAADVIPPKLTGEE